ncbi:MAG: cytidine deaminase [Peptococcaceae bacterium]|nr:cytidine deaminase [Peptococcaceae bacterium]
MQYKDELIKRAKAAKENAYAPYSQFRVGAAILTGEGNYYTGCNIENASYGLACCAERVALYTAIANGELNFSAIAIISDSEEYIPPCGACRQVMIEFSPDMQVIMANNQGEHQTKTATELLPGAFALRP